MFEARAKWDCTIRLVGSWVVKRLKMSKMAYVNPNPRLGVSTTHCAMLYLAGPAHVPWTSDIHVAQKFKEPSFCKDHSWNRAERTKMVCPLSACLVVLNKAWVGSDLEMTFLKVTKLSLRYCREQNLVCAWWLCYSPILWKIQGLAELSKWSRQAAPEWTSSTPSVASGSKQWLSLGRQCNMRRARDRRARVN
jgi:hypothetical protein